MPNPVSRPVAAALGLVPTVLDGVRRLPGRAVQLPVYAVSHALTSIEAARQGYDDLAERGERLIARLRGTSFDELEDRVEDALEGTPLAAPYERVEDALEDVGENVVDLARSAGDRVRKATGAATRSVGSSLSAAASTVEDAAQTVAGKGASDSAEATSTKAAPAKDGAAKDGATKAAPAKSGPAKAAPAKTSPAKTAPARSGSKKPVVDPEAAAQAVAAAQKAVAEAAERAEKAAAEAAEKAAAAGVDPEQAERDRKHPAQAAKGKATPKASQPDDTRVDTAAASDVVKTVEQVSSRVGGAVLEHDELPLPDYDHLTLGSLRGRIRSLDLPQLVQIRDYEKAHADRLPIVTMLDNRIAKLANDPSAPLSGSAPASAASAPDKPKAGKPAVQATPQTADATVSTPAVAFGGLGSSKPS